MPLPAPIGLGAPPQPAAWSVARLERIVRRCNLQPEEAQALLEARHARHCLSQFWLAAPIDLLPSLYAGPIGAVYRDLLHGCLPSQPLAADEARWKERLAHRLQQDLEAPLRASLLLAVMPYCAPGRLRLASPQSDLPAWLLADYSRCFDPDLARRSDRPLALPEQSPVALSSQPSLIDPSPWPEAGPAPVQPIPDPSLSSRMPPSGLQPPAAAVASLPALSERRGNDAFAPFQDSAFVERMIGLINLFRLDPGDRSVAEELQGLRRLIGQVWLDVDASSLEALYHTALGEVYRALLASDIGSLPLQGQDLALRQALTAVAVDQRHPAMVQAMLAVMPFHPQGRMRLGEGQSRLPLWLQEEFAGLSGLQRNR
ncbi:MAG: hypothetical protein ACKOXO_04265 [Cyanobium sp.]